MRREMRVSMKHLRNMCLVGLVTAVALLSACGVSRADASTYVQGELDAVYRGVCNDDYLK